LPSPALIPVFSPICSSDICEFISLDYIFFPNKKVKPPISQ
jgi:hypothetical protein